MSWIPVALASLPLLALTAWSLWACSPKRRGEVRR